MVQYIGTAAQARRRRRRPSSVGQVDDSPFLARLDWTLMLASAALVGYGLWAIGGITRHVIPGDPNYYLSRQFVFVAVGGVAMIAAIAIDPDWYRRSMRGIYVVLLGSLALVMLAGSVSRHSRRWIDVSFFRFQPSEFGKLLLVLFLAAFLADRLNRIDEWRTPLTAIALAVPPILLVFAQPDLGSALVYVAALVGCLFISGTRWSQLAVFGGAALFLAVAVLWLLPAAGVQVLKPYQKNRLTGFLHPGSNTQSDTYNVNQAMIAVGSGGATGRGTTASSQTNLDYLPESQTDFAFAAFAEQRGFIGVAGLLLLYLLVVWRGLKIVTVARDGFSAIVAAGIVFAFVFQIFVNVGMTIGLAPVTGITLPFVSVGGSSLIASMAMIGLLQAIHARGRRRT
ncbi:MAG TPA: rod shape-determining protein RodA [Gaiellaceae bacterium]|nr:rod shape-determining protein RodA [Gaiellaceae bacterium]